MTFFGCLQQTAEGFLLQIHILSGLYGSWSRKYDPGITDQGTDTARGARMQRRGHMGRAHYGASQSRQTETKKVKSLRDLIFVVCIIWLLTWYAVIKRSSRRRYLMFVATTLSNVRRDGVI